MPTRQPARRRRRIIVAAAAGGIVVCLLAAAEVAARTVVDDALGEAVPAGVTVAPTGSAAWSLLTGSMQVTIRIDQTALTDMLGGLAESVRIDDAILVSTTRTSPMGEIPIEIELTPVVENGALGVQVVEASINGMTLPSAGLDGLGPFTLADPAGAGCVGFTATAASIDGDTIVVDGSVPVGRGEGATC